MRAVHVRLCASMLFVVIGAGNLLLCSTEVLFFEDSAQVEKRTTGRTSRCRRCNAQLQRTYAVRFRTRSRHRLLSSAADGLYGAGRCHPG